VVDIRPNKADTCRVRLTLGGNLPQYPGGVSILSSELTSSKCLCNSTISTEGGMYMCLDVNNFYLGTPMDSFEYMRISIKLIPQEIIAEYNLLSLVSDGHMHIEVQKCMYGIPQAEILVNQLIAGRLAIHGYHQIKLTPGIWRHVTHPIQFTFVVDDFGVPGDTSMGDYFIKYHSPAHHKCMIPYYLHDKHSPMIRHDTRLAIM
jgi:hypothetical protein